MTGEKVKEVLAMYDKKLERGGAVVKAEVSGGTRNDHLRYVCTTAQTFIDDGRLEKAMRWLGFVQGAFWTTGRYTIGEMAAHNRPAAGEEE